MPSGICMEIYAEIEGKEEETGIREFLGNPTSIYRLTNHISI